MIVNQRKQTGFDMTLAIKAHFSQIINPHLTQIQYNLIKENSAIAM